MKKTLVPLAPGFEEIEAATIIDVLRRAGAEVTVAGTVPGLIEGSHGLRFGTDASMADVQGRSFDLVALPGGMPGATNLLECKELAQVLRESESEGRLVAAICAAPLVLSQLGFLSDRMATSYPSFRDRIQSRRYIDERVVVDRGVVTSRGVGTALEFALELVTILFGKEKSDHLRDSMLVQE